MATKAKLPSTAVGRRRLLKLADLLEADAKNKKGIKFDMGTWGHVRNEDKPLSCGTAACAMGLAALSKQFRSLRPSIRHGELLFSWGGSETSDGISVGCGLFQIDVDVSGWLFYGSNYPGDGIGAKGERAVAKRIRDFVAGKAAPEIAW